MTSPNEFSEYLDTLIAKAPALRAAGVLSFKAAQFGEVMLNPSAGNLLPEIPKASVGDQGSEEGDPLDDPLAYGLAPGEKLPWQDEDDQQ